MSKWYKNWFSNMLPFDSPLVYKGFSYPTVENFYQAMKMPSFRLDLIEEISQMSPFEAKKAVKTERFQPWTRFWGKEYSLDIMDYALRHKFAPGTSWYCKLMETGDEEIVEWNNWGDVVWGKDLTTKKGENQLGKLLMRIRSEHRLDEVIQQASNP